MDFSIGPLFGALNALARTFIALVPGQVKIHRKAIEEHSVLFWVVHEPQYPGQPLWAELTIAGQRQRISVIWPREQLGLPFGIEGDSTKACYCRLFSAAYVEEAVSQGLEHFRISESTNLDALARSNWSSSAHQRACFKVTFSTHKHFFGDWMKVQILDTSRKVRALSFVRVPSI